MLINSKSFKEISFFLGGSKKVQSLEVGAVENGGATKMQDGIYSNIETTDFINLNENGNKLSVFVPSTLAADQEINSSDYIKKYYDIIENRYSDTITVLKTKGSWYSDDMKKVIVEDITVLTLNRKKATVKDIKFFLKLGLQVKEEMSQEAVSVNVNGALCLV